MASNSSHRTSKRPFQAARAQRKFPAGYIKHGWGRVHPNSMAARKLGRKSFFFNGDRP